MLFLLRPRQTWMPYRLPRGVTQQEAYNRHLQDQFDATRRVPPAPPAAATTSDPIEGLKELDRLHRSGALSDTEFAAAKAKLLGLEDAAS